MRQLLVLSIGPKRRRGRVRHNTVAYIPCMTPLLHLYDSSCGSLLTETDVLQLSDMLCGNYDMPHSITGRSGTPRGENQEFRLPCRRSTEIGELSLCFRRVGTTRTTDSLAFISSFIYNTHREEQTTFRRILEDLDNLPSWSRRYLDAFYS